MKYVLLLCLFGTNLNCSSAVDYKTPVTNQGHMANQDKLSYDSTVLEIMKKVVDLTSSSDLFGVKDFIALYENPTLYQNDAIAFLANEKYSYEEKAIVVYAMQKAELKVYKGFLNEVIKLFYERKINESMLGLALSAPINKRYIVIKNYSDEDISAMLKDLKNSESTSPEFKERIENILSGKSWKGVKKLL